MKLNSNTLVTVGIVGALGYLVFQTRKEALKSEPIVGPFGIRFPRW